MQQIKKFFKTPYYFQWLIVFFVLHGYSDFIGFIRMPSLLLLILIYSLVAWLLFFGFRIMYRNTHKAAWLVTILFFCYLFFGAIQDGLSQQPVVSTLSRLSVFLPLVLLLCLIAAAGLFLYKKSPARPAVLLNLLFLIYIVYDVAVIAVKSMHNNAYHAKQPEPVLAPVPDSLQKPDVYLVLLDEYMGMYGLQEYFHYDNSAFSSFLRQKGFYVCSRSVSNYSQTVFSMASLFNMRYLSLADRGLTFKDHYKSMIALIKNNQTCATFSKLHYTIRNLSPFMFWNSDRATSYNLLPTDIELITDRTALDRVEEGLRFGNTPASRQYMSLFSKYLYKNIDAGHEKVMQAALSDVGKGSPVFTYIHLLMPHRPYVYDSTGSMPEYKNAGNDDLYLQFLVHTNKRIGRFIDQLYQATQGKAVILLMSDHGYRDVLRPGTSRLRFSTLNAVYLPNRDYHLWYDSVSNVNQFPLLFNTLFRQQIPVQKDSCVY